MLLVLFCINYKY